MNSIRFLPGLFLLALIISISDAQTTLVVDSAFAPSLNRMTTFAVLLPAGYQSSEQYPVLYLLHGLGGHYSNWTQRTNLAAYALPYRLLVVMPDAGSSWYVNARNTPEDRYEDFIVEDLPRIVGAKYLLDSSRVGIAGLSMGGYGAAMLALRHPSQYRIAGSLSGAVIIPNAAESLRANSAKRDIDNFNRVFGDTPGEFYDEHDVLKLAVASTPAKAPYLYLAAGIQDEFSTLLAGHRTLADTLRVHGFAYEYHELPGKHNWAFWAQEVQPLLKRIMEVFDETKNISQ
jgi:S-formylglutathione hydrolase FrmB